MKLLRDENTSFEIATKINRYQRIIKKRMEYIGRIKARQNDRKKEKLEKGNKPEK